MKTPGLVSFYPEEIQRIEDAELILLGVSPHDLADMSLQQRADVMAIAEAKERLKHGKMPS